MLTDHCVRRYKRRAGRDKAMSRQAAREELSELIAARGTPTLKPPLWVFTAGWTTVFWVTIDGRWVLPVEEAALVDGVIPGRPYVATTFIALDLTDADLAEFTREELASLVLLPRRVGQHLAAQRREPRAGCGDQLRRAIADRSRASPTAPVWLHTRRPIEDRFFITVDDCMLIVSALGETRATVHRSAPSSCFTRAGLRELRGEELLREVQLEPRAVARYRGGVGVPDDARARLEQRIVVNGRIFDRLPEWAPRALTWYGPVVVVDDAFLLLGLNTTYGATARWRAVACHWRDSRGAQQEDSEPVE